MKNLIAVAALVAAIASPALAQAAPQSGTAVYSSGQYLGSDPDANVRLDLSREAASRNGG
jgi:opacity protein-like surface antigen